ncbi:MAG: hypothetical protein HYV51_00060 [Parcubacteria group bacterium]|nr:hypothetical protein [Parcubacteria group bacterium]
MKLPMEPARNFMFAQSLSCGEVIEPSPLVSPPFVSSFREVKKIGLSGVVEAIKLP